jgi:4-amino-4-deoxy-L-arabinose transferase-like glycosyltransferase
VTVPNRRLSLPLLIAGAAVLLGTGLRLYHVGDRSMTHVEMFVPGIPLAAELSIPKPRMDLWTVVTNTLSSDTHPPGYYVVMWFVTRCFGSGTLAIRLPSVLFGVVSIGLVFWLGVLIGQRMPACVAAAFLALNGYHIVWSRTGRMYSMLCFLGLLTTILMLLLARSAGRRRALEIGYAVLTLLGLSTHVFFWALLATQMAWVLGNAWTRYRPMPRLLSIQILVVILGSPLLAFAAYQSGNQVAFLSSNVPLMAREYVQFVYLIPGWDDTFAPGGTPALALAPQFFLPRVMLLLLCVLLLIMGIRRLKPADERLLGEPAGPFSGGWLLAAVLAVIAILAHIVTAGHHLEPKPTLKYTKAMTPLSLVLFFGATLLRRSWDRSRIWCSRWSLKFLEGGPPLVWMLAVGPFVMLAAVSVVFRPLMDQRGLLFLAPYLLLTLAAGALALGQRSRWLALTLFLILGTLHGFSVSAYNNRIASPVDYKGFADKLKSRLQGGDLIFLSRAWYSTPILYYLTPDHYHLLAGNFVDACRRNPNARVWALLFHGEEFPPGMEPALEKYREVETVEVYLAHGVLYQHAVSDAAAGRPQH